MLLRAFGQSNGIPDHDALPRLCAATERFKRAVESGSLTLDPVSQAMLEDLFAASAEAEQSIALQRARIRFLEGLSITDELTSLLNRRGFDLELKRALARAERQGETGLLLLIDLDGFKQTNDTYGHLAGDAVLAGVADLLKRQTRQSDCVARLGGDEFAVLFTHMHPEKAERRCRKLEILVNNLTVRWDRLEIPVAASFGIQAYDESSHAETLLFLADRDLYRHKRPKPLNVIQSN